jgi:hypothetical protein
MEMLSLTRNEETGDNQPAKIVMGVVKSATNVHGLFTGI